MERRSFVGLLLTAATTGCLHGGGGVGDETEPPEQAEFSLTGWVPQGEYSSLTYLDYSGLREYTSLGVDGKTLTLVGDIGLEYTEIEELISTDGADDTGFEAYRGNFDADGLTESIVDEVDDAEISEHKGYTVVSRSDGGQGKIAFSDSSILVGTPEVPATVVDVSVGDATAQVESDDFLSEARDFVEDPIASSFDYAIGTHRALDEREEGLRYVENIKYGTEEKAQNASESYPAPENSTKVQGKWFSIATPEGGNGIPLLLSGGQFPRWRGQSQENKI